MSRQEQFSARLLFSNVKHCLSREIFLKQWLITEISSAEGQINYPLTMK